MGQTMTTWISDVSEILRDAANQTVTQDVVERRVVAALTQYSVDRPRTITTEQPGSGTVYQPLPATADGWVAGFSRIAAVEHPARQNPPVILNPGDWTIGRDPATVATERLVLPDTAATTQFVRITFTTTWPTPDTDPATDLVDPVGYHALGHLAASLVLTQRMAGAAGTRQGLMATTAREGDSATDRLMNAAENLRAVYAAYLGVATRPLASVQPAGGPAYASIDYNPSFGSLFHGGRR